MGHVGWSMGSLYRGAEGNEIQPARATPTWGMNQGEVNRFAKRYIGSYPAPLFVLEYENEDSCCLGFRPGVAESIHGL